MFTNFPFSNWTHIVLNQNGKFVDGGVIFGGLSDSSPSSIRESTLNTGLCYKPHSPDARSGKVVPRLPSPAPTSVETAPLPPISMEPGATAPYCPPQADPSICNLTPLPTCTSRQVTALCRLLKGLWLLHLFSAACCRITRTMTLKFLYLRKIFELNHFN